MNIVKVVCPVGVYPRLTLYASAKYGRLAGGFQNAHPEVAVRIDRIALASALAILAVVVFIWMHHQMFPTETLGGLLNSLLRVNPFFLVLAFAITMYLRQVMYKNTRTILRALANTRRR